MMMVQMSPRKKELLIPRWVYGGDMRLWMALLFAGLFCADMRFRATRYKQKWTYASTRPTRIGKHHAKALQGPRHAKKTPMFQQIGFISKTPKESVDGVLQLA